MRSGDETEKIMDLCVTYYMVEVYTVVDATDRILFHFSVSAEIMCWEGDSINSHTT